MARIQPPEMTRTDSRADSVRDMFRRSIEVKQKLIGDHADRVVSMADICIDSLSAGGKLLLCGNGGSAADAQHLAADMLVRLRFFHADVTNIIPLKLTQEEIGDATGLTAVHVNRTLRALVDEGLIARGGGAIRILDPDRLMRVSNHVARTARIDPAWLPKSQV